MAVRNVLLTEQANATLQAVEKVRTNASVIQVVESKPAAPERSTAAHASFSMAECLTAEWLWNRLPRKRGAPSTLGVAVGVHPMAGRPEYRKPGGRLRRRLGFTGAASAGAAGLCCVHPQRRRRRPPRVDFASFARPLPIRVPAIFFKSELSAQTDLTSGSVTCMLRT